MKKYRVVGAIIAVVALFLGACPPAISDVGFLTITGNPLTSANAPYLILAGLNSQSACSVSFSGTVSGSYAVEGIYASTQTWTPALTVVAPDGTNPATSITAAGSYAFNCADMVAVRVDGSSGGGSPNVTINASGAVGRVLGTGVNGGRTNLVGSGPITVTNSGNTSTVGLTSPLAILYGGTNNTTFTNGQAITYNGTQFVSTPFPASTPVSVQGGTGITVATPSPGVFVVNATSPTPAPTLTSGPGISTTNNYSSYTYPFTVGGTGSGPGSDILQLVFSAPIPAGCPNPGYYNYLVPAGYTPTQIASGWAAYITYTSGSPCLTASSVGPVMTVNTTSYYGPMTVNVSGSMQETVTPSTQTGSGGSTQTTIANTGALQVTSGSSNVTVTTPTPGVYQVAVATPTPFAGVTSVSGTGNIASTGGTTPVISITNAPTFANVTDSALTSGQCVQASTGGLLSVTGSACGTGSGTVTAVTGTSPIVSSGGATPAVSCSTCLTGLTAGSSILVGTGTTPSVAVTAAPTFANVTDSALTSGNCVQATTAGLLMTISGACNTTATTTTTGSIMMPAVGSTVSVPVSVSTIPLYSTLVITDGTTNAFAGTVTAGGSTATLTVTNNQVIAGTVGNTIASGAYVRSGSATGQVTAITAGSNISVAGTATNPSVAIFTNPAFNSISLATPLPVSSGGTNTATLTQNKCLRSGSGGTAIGTSNMDCPFATTSGSFVIPAVGSTVSVSLNIAAYTKNYETLNISDGTNAMVGLITAGATLTTLTVQNTGMLAGSVGNTMASGAYTIPGGFPYSRNIINLELGFATGVVATSTVYPYQQVPSYSLGTITRLRAACGTSDNGTTVFTVTDVTSSSTIGTISMASSATTATTTLGTPYALTAGHVINMAVTTAGTATNCGVTAEGFQTPQ